MYCCDRFEVGCKHKDRIYPNIRIVRFVSDFLIKKNDGIFIIRGGIDDKFIENSKSPYRYFIGYTTDNFSFGSPQFNMINFCPYCGQNLYKFYNKNEYTNEIEGQTFKL
jgi:hypothetical protein